MTTTNGLDSTGPRARLRWIVLAAFLLSFVTGCASESGMGRDGPMGPVLPRPFGSVSVDDQPIAWACEWAGIIGGTVAFGVFGYHGLFGGESNLGRGAWLGLVGGFLGGVVMAVPGHLLQWLWDKVTGKEREEPRERSFEGE